MIQAGYELFCGFTLSLTATVKPHLLKDDILLHLEKVIKLLVHHAVLLPIRVGDVSGSEGILASSPVEYNSLLICLLSL